MQAYEEHWLVNLMNNTLALGLLQCIMDAQQKA